MGKNNSLSDHFPIWGTIRGKFAKKHVGQKEQKQTLNFDSVKPSAVTTFNDQLYTSRGDRQHEGHRDAELFCGNMLRIAREVLPVKERQPKKPWITQQTLKLIESKHQISRKNDLQAFKQISREVKKATKHDWESWLANITDKELDLRDKWLGIRFLKNKFAHKTYERADRFGKQVNFDQEASTAAEYLEKEQWGNENAGLFNSEEVRIAKCNVKDNRVNTSSFNVEEIRTIIKRMKNHKASGPDEVPMELFKLLDNNNLQWLTDIYNQWWCSGECPTNLLRALVASIYKKGDPKKQSNYRPISLLNAVYKIYAALLQTRLAEAIDDDLQNTQFGFRKARSTTIPINCLKRIVERAYASQDPAVLVFLDWEKAFDRIRQDKIIECLERMNVD